MTINDYETLLVLSRADGRRLKRVELSRQLLLTPSGITRLLEGLQVGSRRAGVVCFRPPGYLRTAYRCRRRAPRSCSKLTHRVDHSAVRTHLSAAEITALADTLDKFPGVATTNDSCRVD